MSPELHSFSYGTRELAFHLSYSSRRTVSITVLPNSKLQVVAPTDTPLEQVLAAIRRRAPWIVRQLQFFATVPAPPLTREYVAGETHRYLGRQYRLRIQEPIFKKADSESVKLRGAYIEVNTHQPESPAHTRQLVECWYLQHARQHLNERYQYCTELVRRYGITAPDWQLRTMFTRWGSYTRSGRILLNPHLIQAPTACIDYLIIHELCHVAHPHHGPDFYQLLTRLLPTWPVLRERLNQYS